MIHKIASCDPSGLPIGASANDRRFKAALLDIGLLQNLCRVPVELELRERDLLAMYRGALAAQFVAQEMMAASDHELYYWARDARGSSAEVDYLAIREGRILPVEVKSGAGGSLRSLHLMLATYSQLPGGDGPVLRNLRPRTGTAPHLPAPLLRRPHRRPTPRPCMMATATTAGPYTGRRPTRRPAFGRNATRASPTRLRPAE